MKKIYLLAVLCALSNIAFSQVYYNMWRGDGDSGKPEWLANLSMRTRDNHTGIEFTTANTCRGSVNGTGRWGFLAPGTRMDPTSFNNVINGISKLTLGVEGWVCPEGLSVRKLWDGVTTTLDLISVDGKSTITSNGDTQGLHIKSAIGGKIYMYNKVYFNDKYWFTLGSGRNNDPTINNPNTKMFRIGSNDGLGFWSNGKVETDDAPNMQITKSGGVCVGNIPATFKLNVAGSIFAEQNGMKFLSGFNTSGVWLGTKSNHGLYIGTNNYSMFYIDTDQNTYVGLTESEVKGITPSLKSKYRMFVKKGILSEDFSIAPVSSWADYVFNKDYNLLNLNDLSSYINLNGHLPNVPSKKDVESKGYSQHEINKVLLEKIEELTLYTISQQKEITNLKHKIEELEN